MIYQVPPNEHQNENLPDYDQQHHRNCREDPKFDMNVIWTANAVCILILTVVQLPIRIRNNFVVKQVLFAEIVLSIYFKCIYTVTILNTVYNILIWTIISREISEMMIHI